MRYKKIAHEVEAFFVDEKTISDIGTWPNWLIDEIGRGLVIAKKKGLPCLVVNTLEGQYDVYPNYYIIKGIEGELYPCEPNIFNKSYKKINTNPFFPKMYDVEIIEEDCVGTIDEWDLVFNYQGEWVS